MPNKRTNQFLNLSEVELREALIENAYRKDEESRRWFSRFKFANDSINGNPATALGAGLTLLIKCKELDEKAYKEIHKGGAFYWLGIASFLVHEYELATFFFDAAVSEDIRAGDDPINGPSPAMRFMRMDGEHPNQAARDLVRDAQSRIQSLIQDYNARSDNSTNNVTIQILRERLFIPSILEVHKNWRSLTSTFISFILEWDYRNVLFDIRITPGTYEPFYIHLFKGCLLFESLLKENPSDPWVPQSPRENTLGKALEKYSSVLVSNVNLGQNISGPDLPTILKDLQTADNSLLSAIKYTARLRNTLGHNLGWDNGLTKSEYFRLFQMVASSCIHVVMRLYSYTQKQSRLT